MTRVLLERLLIRFDGKPGLPGLLEHESELIVCIGEVRIELNGFLKIRYCRVGLSLSLSIRVPNDNRPRKDRIKLKRFLKTILWHRRSVPLPYTRPRDCNKQARAPDLIGALSENR